MKQMILVLGLVVLAGCNKAEEARDTARDVQTATTEQAEMGSEGEAMNPAVAEAILQGDGARCTLVDGEGKTMVYQVKAERMRASGLPSLTGNNGNMIVNEQATYFWTEGEAEGVMIAKTATDAEQAEKLTERYVSEVPDFSDEAQAADYESRGYQVDCAPELVEDALFVPPQNVTFTDLVAHMQQAAESQPVDTAEFEEEMRKMMEYDAMQQ